jgi:hypothetical protein
VNTCFALARYAQRHTQKALACCREEMTCRWAGKVRNDSAHCAIRCDAVVVNGATHTWLTAWLFHSSRIHGLQLSLPAPPHSTYADRKRGFGLQITAQVIAKRMNLFSLSNHEPVAKNYEYFPAGSQCRYQVSSCAW